MNIPLPPYWTPDPYAPHAIPVFEYYLLLIGMVAGIACFIWLISQKVMPEAMEMVHDTETYKKWKEKRKRV